MVVFSRKKVWNKCYWLFYNGRLIWCVSAISALEGVISPRRRPSLTVAFFRSFALVASEARINYLRVETYEIPGANFMSRKSRVKFLLVEFLWTLIDSLLHFLAQCMFTLKLSRIYSQGEKEGKVTIKAQRNSTRRNFTLNFWLMKLTPGCASHADKLTSDEFLFLFLCSQIPLFPPPFHVTFSYLEIA